MALGTITPSVGRLARWTAISVAALTALGGCTTNTDWAGPHGPNPTDPNRPALLAEPVRLSRAESCSALADDARALRQMAEEFTVTTDSDTTGPSAVMGADRAASPSASAAGSAAESGDSAKSAGQAAESSDSTAADGSVVSTNNQEVGVDEGDVIKTDGKKIVSVVNGVLRVTMLDGSPAVDGVLDTGAYGDPELFLNGDEALLIDASNGVARGAPPIDDRVPAVDPTIGADPAIGIAPNTGSDPMAGVDRVDGSSVEEAEVSQGDVASSSRMMMPAIQYTRLTRVALSDPTNPVVAESVQVEGSAVASRSIDGTVRVVLRNDTMQIEPMPGSDDTQSSNLLPQVIDESGSTSPLGDCTDVMVATETGSAGATSPSPDPRRGPSPEPVPMPKPSPMPIPQPSTVTVLTIDGPLNDLHPISVQGSVETVYAATNALFVASQTWDQNGSRTNFHRFDLTAPGAARYTGSGQAPGALLNQFSLSERDGALRVVTTVEGTPGPADVMSTSARLSILSTEGETMNEIGHIDGMGEGEMVKSVRFMDNLGYVVTFRQTDPLYALDLSDPRSPRVLGELKISGFSQYLHPIGDGLLLGVGREADVTSGGDEGFKVSLFDISNPGEMVEVDRIVLPDAYSPVGDDHKAFTWDPSRRHAIIPIEEQCPANADCMAGLGGSAMVVSVEGGTGGGAKLNTVGQLRHTSVDDYKPVPIRSVIVGNDLWTLSEAGLGRSNADLPTDVDLLLSFES